MMDNTHPKLEIWRALSDLFLDTEMNQIVYRHIARVIFDSEFSLSDAEQILWQEVYPVLEINLLCVAGVWDGFSDEWLLKHLKPRQLSVPAPSKIMNGNSIIRDDIKHCWQQVVSEYEDLQESPQK